MDLSKAFDRMPHGLFIIQLHACGLSEQNVTEWKLWDNLMIKPE